MQLVQGSPEWLEWRRGGIGSSDAPAVLGESPFRTPFQVFEIKKGRAPESADNENMRRGRELEPKAREAYQKQTGILMPAENLEHPTMPFIRASFDGLNLGAGLILEVKCGRSSHEMALAGKIPEYYKAQLAHQMLVANVNTVHYFSFNGEEGKLIEFHRNEQYEKELITKEKAFWDCVTKDEAPEFIDRDYTSITDPDAISWASNYRSLDAQIKELEAKKVGAREALIALAAGERIICNNVMVYSATRKGNVNYKSIPELKGVDLEKYRGKSSSVTTVRVK